MLVTVNGFHKSSRTLGTTSTTSRIYDTFLPGDPTNCTRCTILSTDVLNWRYATLSIQEEKAVIKATGRRTSGHSIFEMDKDTADFVGAVYKEKGKK